MRGPHGVVIDRDFLPVRPDRVGAGPRALEVMDGAVDLQKLFFLEPRLLELAVHVGGDDEMRKAEAFDPLPQDRKPFVGLRGPV